MEGKVKKQATVKTKVTKRPHQKIMDKLRQKIAQKLREKLGEEFGEEIMVALKASQVDLQIKELVKENKLLLVDQRNNPVYTKEMREELKEASLKGQKRKYSVAVQQQ